jgi:hypothetical protein
MSYSERDGQVIETDFYGAYLTLILRDSLGRVLHWWHVMRPETSTWNLLG